MHAFVRFVRFLVAATLAVFALPAAATYYYSLNMCAYGTGCTSPIAMTTSVANVSTGTVTAIIKNESPANLTMKSFTLSVPAGSGLTITDATLPAGQTATKTIQGGTLTVKSMSIGIVKGAQYAVTLTVQATQCTAISGNWTTQPWTGTALNGSKYIMYPVSATHPATTFTPACTVPITITANPTAGGSASCSPNPVPYGGSSTCTATANAGYAFTGFSGDCTGSSCTLSGVTSAKNVTANFGVNTFPITTAVNVTEGGSVNCVPNPVPYGGNSTCTATAGTGYTFTAFSGDCTGATCALTNVTSNKSVTANFASNTLTITSAPTSAAVNVPFNVVVSTSPGSPAVSMSSSCLATETHTSSGNSTSFSVTIPTAGVCNFTFSATNYPTAPLSLKAFAFQADQCSPPTASSGVPGSTFDASALCSSGVGVNVSGFAAGFRSVNKDQTCPALDFTLTNNICGPGPTQDASGKTIPPNAVSLVWDTAQRAAFTYTVTWKAEYVDPATGLPFPQKTRYCVGTDPANPCGNLADPFDPNRRPLKACTSPDVAFTSIPTGEPACISEEDWVTVPQTECGATMPIPAGTPACIRATTIIIDAVDPAIIRG